MLSRVQSEAVPLQKGQEGEITVLPARRHSAVITVRTSGGPEAVVRFARRKNKPDGSVLRRPCSCALVGSPQFCFAHRLEAFLAEMELAVGDRMFKFTGAVFLKKVVRFLKILQVPGAEHYTLKSFRAGRATEMAGTGTF